MMQGANRRLIHKPKPCVRSVRVDIHYGPLAGSATICSHANRGRPFLPDRLLNR